MNLFQHLSLPNLNLLVHLFSNICHIKFHFSTTGILKTYVELFSLPIWSAARHRRALFSKSKIGRMKFYKGNLSVLITSLVKKVVMVVLLTKGFHRRSFPWLFAKFSKIKSFRGTLDDYIN